MLHPSPNFIFLFSLYGWDKFSLYSPCWPRTHNPPASACWGLELQVGATIFQLLLVTPFYWSTWHQQETPEKGNLGWEKTSIRLFLGSLWGIFLTNDWCGRAQLPLGRTSPQQLILSSTRAEGAMRNKPVGSVVLWSHASVPAATFVSFDFPRWSAVTGMCKPNKPFLPQGVF